MMAFTTVFEDIIFVEGDFKGAIRGNPITNDLTYSFGAQLKSLRDIKHNLAQQAKSKGYNAVINFEYGQKTRFFAFDNVGFYGKGILAKISQSDYEHLCATLP